MRAGLLREKVTFYAITTKQTDSGFVSKTKTNIATVRCYRKRKVDNSQMVGQEEFNAGTVTLQVRNDPDWPTSLILATRMRITTSCKT